MGTSRRHWGTAALTEWLVQEHGLKTAKAEAIARSLPEKMAEQLNADNTVVFTKLASLRLSTRSKMRMDPETRAMGLRMVTELTIVVPDDGLVKRTEVRYRNVHGRR